MSTQRVCKLGGSPAAAGPRPVRDLGPYRGEGGRDSGSSSDMQITARAPCVCGWAFCANGGKDEGQWAKG